MKTLTMESTFSIFSLTLGLCLCVCKRDTHASDACCLCQQVWVKWLHSYSQYLTVLVQNLGEI